MLTTDENIDKLSGEDLAWMLKNIYGPTVLSVGARVVREGHTMKHEESEAIVLGWADYAQPDVQPSEENMIRMRAMLRVWFLLAPEVGRSQALWWFAGMIEGSFVGVRDDENRQSPNMLANEGKIDELMDRAEMFRYFIDHDVWA